MILLKNWQSNFNFLSTLNPVSKNLDLLGMLPGLSGAAATAWPRESRVQLEIAKFQTF